MIITKFWWLDLPSRKIVPIRNTKVVDFIAELVEFGFDIDIWDPLVDPSDVQEKYGLKIIKEPKQKYYSIVALVVPHDQIVKRY